MNTQQATPLRFVYAGAAKAGSTWMWRILSEHPDIFMPQAKELMFFDEYYQNGLNWYETFFRGRTTETCMGEMSHNYFLNEQVPHRIHKHFPEMELLFCLREPIDRAFSEYLYDRTLFQYVSKKEYDRGVDFETFARLEKIRVQSSYYQNLKPYFDLFPRERIHVFFYEDLKKDSEAFARTLYTSLGVDPAFTAPSLHKVLNPARKARIPVLAALSFQIGRCIRNLGAPGVVGRMKRIPWFEKLLYATYNNSDSKPRPDPEVCHRLRPLYHSDHHALAELLQRELPASWITSAKD